jgi:transposase-like protein
VVLIGIGIDRDGRRRIITAEIAHRESRSTWKNSL